MSINIVSISGNLTRNSELRQSQTGTSVLSFGVAVNDRHLNKQTNQWEEYPNFIDCVMFGNRAESLQPYLVKGLKVSVEGKLHYSSWMTQDNQKRSKIEVIVDDIDFVSSSNNQQTQYAQYQQQMPPQMPPQPQAPMQQTPQMPPQPQAPVQQTPQMPQQQYQQPTQPQQPQQPQQPVTFEQDEIPF